MSSLVVAGLDPGSRSFGWAVLEIVLGRGRPLVFRRIDSGEIQLEIYEPHERLGRIYSELCNLFSKIRPARVGIERGFVDWRSRDREQTMHSVLTLAEARGVGRLVASQFCPIVHGGPTQTIRKYVCLGGSGGRADKIEVQESVCRTLNLSRCPGPDEADAMAVAIWQGWEACS